MPALPQEMKNLRAFVGPFVKDIVSTLNISRLIVDENASLGGPMTLLFTLSLSEDMPPLDLIKDLCEKHRTFPFPFIIELPKRELGCFTVAVDYNK